MKKILSKIASIIILVVLGIMTYHVAKIGFSELQTFYFHILMVFAWLFTSAMGIWLYNVWQLTRHNSHGEDNKLNQAERLGIQRVHAAILMASAILVFASIFVYYGKKGDEQLEQAQPAFNNYINNVGVVEFGASSNNTNTLRNFM